MDYQQRSVSVLLFPGFSNLCLANAVEPLRAANTLARRELYRWSYLAIDAGAQLSSSRLPVTPEATLARAGRADFLFVMPSYGFEALGVPAVVRALRAAAPRFGTLVGLDTGSLVLAAAGLLDGYRATSHWDVLSAFEERYPEVDVVTDRFVIDRDRASCGGATTTLDLMLELVRRHHGAMLSLDVAALFMHGERQADPALNLPPDRVVRAAAAMMRRHVEDPVPVAEVARALGVSQRGLEQHFARVVGRSPRQVYGAIRLGEALRLAEQTRLSMAEIAGRVGYRNASAMTRAFKAEFGAPPQRMRAAAREG
ncbi:GlxA family transcriptional regulator [Ovoidimarina sediminis]|uniref:GlxA family transcriptional regulator n=1 Tax=Ovoidimarina sediminis TaxID=3079856 RepID=UPI002908ADE9|nr:helix-turn-helix domain-containing protein [Rhodophyticola sp. MJ-SS7]MDU8943151.1 helix-turn-helix domain-containing protein [Rhodophyticola sp. MJ-SS7]